MTESAIASKPSIINNYRGLPERKAPVALPTGNEGQVILHTAIRQALKTYLANENLLRFQASRLKDGDSHTAFLYVADLDLYMRVAKNARLAAGIRIAAFDLLVAMGYYLLPGEHQTARALIADLLPDSKARQSVRLRIALEKLDTLHG